MNLKIEYSDLYKNISKKIDTALKRSKRLKKDVFGNIGKTIAKENKRIYEAVKRDTARFLNTAVKNAVNKFDKSLRTEILKNTDFTFLLDDDFNVFPEPDYKKSELWNTKKVKQAIILSLSLGEDSDKLLQRIRKVVKMNYYDMSMRAKTLRNAAENFAMQKVFETASKYVKIKKKWIDKHDGLVRMSHQRKYGVGYEIVNINERFSNGLLYPCEFGKSWKDIANCRCKLEVVFV